MKNWIKIYFEMAPLKRSKSRKYIADAINVKPCTISNMIADKRNMQEHQLIPFFRETFHDFNKTNRFYIRKVMWHKHTRNLLENEEIDDMCGEWGE